MSNADIRKAHKLLDYVSQGRAVLDDELKLLRSFLPELPKQKTLEEIGFRVYDAWIEASGNEWGGNSYDPDVSIEDWLGDLHFHLKGLMDTPVAEPAKPAHPEFLETEADYAAAPEGTIAACEDSPPWYKFDSVWISTINCGSNSAESMSGIIREVLRWGWGNE